MIPLTLITTAAQPEDTSFRPRTLTAPARTMGSSRPEPTARAGAPFLLHRSKASRRMKSPTSPSFQLIVIEANIRQEIPIEFLVTTGRARREKER